MEALENFSLLGIARAKLHHLPDGRFKNPWLTYEAPKLSKIIKWKISHLIIKEHLHIPITSPSKELFTSSRGPLVCFLGHNTVFIRLEGLNFLFDPIFGNIGGIVKRHTPPPLTPEELPPIDFVIYSHAHRDHLDLPTFRKIPGKPKVIAPLNTSLYLRYESLTELDWFENYQTDLFSITAVPLQHWSKRNLTDTNFSLWAGFILEANGFKLFFGGDTGYFFGFKEIGKIFGPLDLALMPAGAYLPRELMAPFHLSPEEAVKAACELKAHFAMPIHWGVYKLGDEALDDPPKQFQKCSLGTKNKPLISYPGDVVLFEKKKPIFLTSQQSF